MSTQSFPLVTLALPLYTSRGFLDIIIENLETLEYPNLEILISDRHCADDALEVLRARFGNDARFLFLAARDEIGWVAHFNFLLRAAQGKYLLWMPHDDSYAANYVSVLVDVLETFPDALVAYGKMEERYPDRVLVSRTLTSFSPAVVWTPRHAFQLLLAHQLCLPVRGLMRREVLFEKNLLLRPTRESNAADVLWAFAVACQGRMIGTSDTFCVKRFYPTSTHAQWKPRTWRHTLIEAGALRAYLDHPKNSLRQRLRAGWIVLLWTCLRLGGNLRDALHLDTAMDARARQFLFKLNLW